jgi:hypothetical protein
MMATSRVMMSGSQPPATTEAAASRPLANLRVGAMVVRDQ